MIMRRPEDGKGFEPPMDLHPYRISNPALSTAQPPVRAALRSRCVRKEPRRISADPSQRKRKTPLRRWRWAGNADGLELILQFVQYILMENSNSRLKLRALHSGAVIVALTLGACASGSNKTISPDATASSEAQVVDTDGVMVNSGMNETSASLILKVSGYKKQSGQIMVAVYNSEDGFDSEGEPFRAASVVVEAAKTSVTFGGLPAGDYAFKVFHDANGNGKLDTNAFGMPTEKYAFSRDASDPFSAPEWVESKISAALGDNVRNVSLD